MKILPLSDLHLEFFDPDEPILPDGTRLDDDADVIVLAGDISTSTRGIHWAKEYFKKPVIYVAGNHEFYNNHIERTLGHMRLDALHAGIHMLEQSHVEIDGYTFLGATLWTDFAIFGEDLADHCMRQSEKVIRDFRMIYTGPRKGERLITPEEIRDIHMETVRWLDTTLKYSDPENTVIVTHHAPHPNSIAPRYKADPVTGAFVSDLTRFMGRAKLWIHGHTHEAFDYTVNGTNVIANPRGYMMRDGDWENSLHERALLVEI